jgi:hypothetical protein
MFKKVFDKLPKNLTQIAFGADASATANPDLFRMMEYCRENGVVPNITVADINPDSIRLLKKLDFVSIESDLFSNIQGKFDLIIFKIGLRFKPFNFLIQVVFGVFKRRSEQWHLKRM